ncbi:Kv channel-interacting protein 2-like isoform X2 [Gordionus sp. m RMFG-2023]|uniref:Kv channel-interacting protein 2-like isoform X2 n=1 Tax=Gordionus sp. m RMFG-2023 TaxID=3053472 RepID=UPI0031FBD52A
MLRRMFSWFKRFQAKKNEKDIEILNSSVPSVRPENMEKLCQMTKFSRVEIKLLYKSFKQYCPYGIIDSDVFKEIFASFFPHGNSQFYAQKIFRSFDSNDKGFLDFEEFIILLSKISRGTYRDKLDWIFGMYDSNKDGVICKAEMIEVVTSIYLLSNQTEVLQERYHVILDHVERVFKKMDSNKDGLISREEFESSCLKNSYMNQNISQMETL